MASDKPMTLDIRTRKAQKKILEKRIRDIQSRNVQVC